MTVPMIVLCPGQGAQTVSMGRAWADASPEARAVFDRADEVLAAITETDLGQPLSTLCFDGPADRLNQTDAAQPAIYTASVACLAGWKAAAGVSDLPLAAAAGLSLGEYTALHVAGALSFEDGLRLVALRGRAMQDAAEATPSGMVALIGADEAQADELCHKAKLDGEVLVPANFNAPGQVVVSGSAASCARAVEVAADMGLRATPLAVAGAFHSPLMGPAADRLRAALETTTLHDPRCPVYSNVTAAPHEGPDSVRQRLVEQLTAPVRWAQSCEAIRRDHAAAELHELAPGKTLAGLMRRIDRSAKVTGHDEPA